MNRQVFIQLREHSLFMPGGWRGGWQKLGGSSRFSAIELGSPKIIVEVGGGGRLAIFFVQKGMILHFGFVKPVLLHSNPRHNENSSNFFVVALLVLERQLIDFTLANR